MCSFKGCGTTSLADDSGQTRISRQEGPGTDRTRPLLHASASGSTHANTASADLESIAAAERLTYFAFRRLDAVLQRLDDDLDYPGDAVGLANLAQSPTARAVARLAEFVIRHMIRRVLPDMIALEPGTSGASLGGVL